MMPRSDDPTGLSELTREAFRLSRRLERGIDFLREQAGELATAEHDYRLARAKAWGQTIGTAKNREDQVNALTAPERLRRDQAEHLRHAAIEAVRSLRQQVSMIQTIITAHRSEAEFARTAPKGIQE